MSDGKASNNGRRTTPAKKNFPDAPFTAPGPSWSLKTDRDWFDPKPLRIRVRPYRVQGRVWVEQCGRNQVCTEVPCSSVPQNLGTKSWCVSYPASFLWLPVTVQVCPLLDQPGAGLTKRHIRLRQAKNLSVRLMGSPLQSRVKTGRRRHARVRGVIECLCIYTNIR